MEGGARRERDGDEMTLDAAVTGSVDTSPVSMNLTISLDERLLERAREVARQQGTSVDALAGC